MLDLFSDIKSTVLRRRTIFIDNSIFRLHWMVTPALLISFSIILTARQYVGQPIDCLFESNIIQQSMINTYCWISQTFLIPTAFSSKVGIEVAHPGVDNSFYRPSASPTSNAHAAHQSSSPGRKYYPYYQWVCFVLFIQAIIFYMPHYIWKMSEGGLMQNLSMDLQVAIISDEERATRKRLIADYLFHHFQMYNSYVYKYFFCEFMCLLNILSQTLVTDAFLDNQFISYGFNVLKHTQFIQRHVLRHFGASSASNSTSTSSSAGERVATISPFAYVFPRMTKCTFHYFGPSGDVQRKDALCLLPLNVFHEKIYLFLWFWFAALLCLTSLLIFVRLLMILAVRFRPQILKTRCKFCSLKHLRVLCRKGNLGDFFVYYQLGKNIDPIVMQEIVYDVSKRLIRQENYFAFHAPPPGGKKPFKSSSKKYHPI